MDVKLGVKINGPASRDAVHVAIVPVTAATGLRPGEPIELERGSQTQVVNGVKPIGIVDPFLRSPVKTGERFYMFLFPGTVTGMRHHWSHPSFGDEITSEDDHAASVAWLQSAAVKLGVRYEVLVGDDSPLVHNDYIDNGQSIRDIWDDIAAEVWKHRRNVTGVDVGDDARGGFTCSC